MDNNFFDNLQKKENLCKAYMNRAAVALELAGGRHTAEECALLQKAADLQHEMSQITIGEESAYHARRVAELNNRIKLIQSELGPKQAKSAQGGGANENTNENGAQKDELAATVKTWFKEAPKHSFGEVSGMADIKQRLSDCVKDSKLETLLDFLKMKKLNSYFFIGPPGCGKTYIIEAFAHELMDKDFKYMSLVGSDIISRYVGDAEKIVTRLFEEAEKNAPCIVFIDEIDGVCRNRSMPNLPEYAASITTSFLTGYNRINSSDKSIIFIGATNYPKRVDAAMLDRVEVVKVHLPDAEARAFAFGKHFREIIQPEEGFTFEEMAAQTEGYNYRDIDRLSNMIKKLIFNDIMEKLGDQFKAIDAIKSGEYKLYRTTFAQAKAKVLPSPKEEFLREQEEWEQEFLRSQE